MSNEERVMGNIGKDLFAELAGFLFSDTHT